MAQQLLRSAGRRQRSLESLLAQAMRAAAGSEPVASLSFSRSCSIASTSLPASSSIASSSCSSFNPRRAFTSSSRPCAAAAAAAGTSGSGSGDGKDDKAAAEAPSAASTPGTTEWRSWIESRLSELDGGDDEEEEKKKKKDAAAAAAEAAANEAASVTSTEATEAAAAARGGEEGEAAAAATTTPTPTSAPTPPPPPPPRRKLPPPRLAVVEPHAADLPSPFTGYAELGEPLSGGGGRREAAAPGAAAGAAAALPSRSSPSSSPSSFAPGRLHPTRIFYPGQTYEPNELAVPVSTSSSSSGGGAGGGGGASMPFPPHFAQRRAPLPPKSVLFISNASEKRPRTMVDFRDAKILQGLLSETGKLPPRRRTRLSQKHHRHLMRQVKLARQMALLHPLNNRSRVDGGFFGDADGGVGEGGRRDEAASERA